MAPSAGPGPRAPGALTCALLGLLAPGRAKEAPPAPAAAAVRPGSPAQLEWHHVDALNALRTEGFTCPGGRYFPPNPVPLKLDCGLWRIARLRVQEVAAPNQSLAGELVAAGPAAAAEDSLSIFRRSSRHCRIMMEPRAKLVGVAHGAAREDQHHWIQLFGTDEALLDVSCFRASTSSSQASAPTLAPVPALPAAAAPLLVGRPPLAADRRLRPGGVGSAISGPSQHGDSVDSGAEAGAEEEEENTYRGPGQAFGMALLIISVSVFCIGTFGSIAIGNCILEARARKAEERVAALP